MKNISGILIVFLLLACVGAPPPKNAKITKSTLPQEHLIKDVPTYRQPYMDCGPTSLEWS